MDSQKLYDAMNKKGVTAKMLYSAIGISKTAFYRKCRGITEFTLGEMQAIIDYLELENPMEIFFTKKVS